MKLRVLILSLAAAVAAPAMASSPQELMEQMLPVDTVLANAGALGLSGEQEQELRRAVAPLQQEMGPAQHRMRTLNGELVRLLSEAKPDEAVVMAKFAELEAAESKVKSLRLAMTLAAKKVLTAGQQEAARSKALSVSSAVPSEGEAIRGKLQRVRDGIERWQREGRDVSQVRALWSEFQKRAELRHHQLAMQALNEAQALLDGTSQQPNQ